MVSKSRMAEPGKLSRSGGIPYTLRRAGRSLLSSIPLADALFRRTIWSRMHFPEQEMAVLAALPDQSMSVAIDVGAALGCYSWILNRKASRVIAFEPGKAHAREIALGRIFSRIELVKSAVGSFDGNVTLYTPGNDASAHHSATIAASNPIAQGDAVQTMVSQVTLDSYVLPRLAADESVDFIKIDVEGYEGDVIAGGMTVISRYAPVILCEIEARHNAAYGLVFDRLAKEGYESFIFSDGRFEKITSEALPALQNAVDLDYRLSPGFDPALNRYFNNILFQHDRSRTKLAAR